MRSVEDSRQRLGLSKIDMLFVHDIGTMNHGTEQNAIYWKQLTDGGYRALTELKSAGIVKAIGLGVNEWQVLVDALANGDWDAFLLAQRYTLLEQEALSPLMDACLKRGTSIIVGGVLNGGLLVGGDRWNYRPAPENVLVHRAALDSFCSQRGVAIAAAAIQMALAHPASAAFWREEQRRPKRGNSSNGFIPDSAQISGRTSPSPACFVKGRHCRLRA